MRMGNICTTWHSTRLHLKSNISLIKIAGLSKGTVVLFVCWWHTHTPPGKLLCAWPQSDIRMSQGVKSLINSCALIAGWLGINSRLLFQTLISCFNFLSLRIGSKALSLVCSVLHLYSDKKIKMVLSENLSISIIRNTPHKGLG